jgi:hypothetical protein
MFNLILGVICNLHRFVSYPKDFSWARFGHLKHDLGIKLNGGYRNHRRRLFHCCPKLDHTRFSTAIDFVCFKKIKNNKSGVVGRGCTNFPLTMTIE